MVVQDFFADKLRVRIFDTRDAMGACAGEEIAACMKEKLVEKASINVMFAAAPSQKETLATLLADKDIDWTRVIAFHMDEYVGLDPTHPAGFRNFLKKAIFDKKPFQEIYYLNGDAEDSEKEALRYSKLLKDHPLDICILGVGENGHIAFNDPPVADFNDPHYVKVVELEERCRQQQVNDGCFSAINDVPRYALSVTIPGLMHAKHMFCSVPAATKADAIFHMVKGDVSTKCPASILKTHDDARLYTDKDAGRLIL